MPQEGAYRPKAGETVLKIEVEGRGDVVIRLFTDKAPKTTSQIQRLVRSGFYNGQRFHRVEKQPRPYLVQIGDPVSKTNLDSSGNGGSGATVPFEDSGMPHGEGAVGLARSLDNPNSGDSQFYMLLSPARFLDGRYTVFGQVVSGMSVLRSIERGDRVLSMSILTG
jgi:cyclophilin family peptidyl-prolyl cis-trans isomerase